MQEQDYPHERDAIASLNISKNEKFNEQAAIKRLRDICKKLLKNKYENDPKYHIESERELQQLEQAYLEFNFSTEEKEKLRRKIHKSYERKRRRARQQQPEEPDNRQQQQVVPDPALFRPF